MDFIKLIKSFKYAANGIYLAIREGQNMKIHLLMSCIGLLLSWWLKISRIELLFVISVIFFVISLETINTSIEKIVDEISLEKKPSLGAIKDMAAGAVLLGAILSVILGIFIFIPKILSMYW